MSSSTSETVYPLAAVRALALHAQGLNTPLGKEQPPTLDAIFQTVKQLGCIQIDTLQMVQRSQYLVLWSRLGRYNPADFDRLLYDPAERRLFEGWQHAASIIPLSEYRYQIPLQRHIRQGPGAWFRHWLEDPNNVALLKTVHERIRKEGAVRANEFEYNGPKRGSWWDWKPAKIALENLYAFGELMIADRVNFQRVYDLTERVLPEWVDRSEPMEAERDRRWLEHGIRALGICEPIQAAEYAFRKRGEARPYLEDMLAEGVLVQVNARLTDGEVHQLVVHREDLEALERADAGEIKPQRTTFLSPFDNLFWARGRDEQFWGFRNVLEAYKRQPDRIWGYYSMPILHKDRLVGRFDPKLERKSGTLRLKALYLEPDVQLEDDLVIGVTAAMTDFLAFHQASDLLIERSEPAAFADRLAEEILRHG